MKPNEMEPVEIDSPCRFGSRGSLACHVIKHVLLGRDERWHAVLDMQVLTEARDEFSTGEFGPACRRIAAAYERVLEGAVVKVCRGGRRHGHMAEYTLSPEIEKLATGQVVEAWPPDERLWIVTRCSVKGKGFGPYRLKTGYRPWPRLSRKGFARASRQKLEEKVRLRGLHIIEIHDRD